MNAPSTNSSFEQLQTTEVADRQFECPRCGARSSHPEDIANGYCGRCHAFTGRSEQHWIDTLSCGHEQTILVYVPPDRAPVSELVTCLQCGALVVRTAARCE